MLDLTSHSLHSHFHFSCACMRTVYCELNMKMRALAKNKVYFLLQDQSQLHTEPKVWTTEMYSMSAQIGRKNIFSISIKSDLNS